MDALSLDSLAGQTVLELTYLVRLPIIALYFDVMRVGAVVPSLLVGLGLACQAITGCS